MTGEKPESRFVPQKDKASSEQHSDLVRSCRRISPSQSTDNDKRVSGSLTAALATNRISAAFATREDAATARRPTVLRPSQAEPRRKLASSARTEIRHFATLEYVNATVPVLAGNGNGQKRRGVKCICRLRWLFHDEANEQFTAFVKRNYFYARQVMHDILLADVKNNNASQPT